MKGDFISETDKVMLNYYTTFNSGGNIPIFLARFLLFVSK